MGGTACALSGTRQYLAVIPHYSRHPAQSDLASWFNRGYDNFDADVTHYIAADEVQWDYTPLGRDGFIGELFGDVENVVTEPGPFTPGSQCIKAVY
ncbi:hypothetical protein BWQ96_10330 [Gracilariopsis chorda]|uniref:Uncharacterized protein n=1 Tax=Gracilariopsis chorda TaxID=448386 RepID=A0A2V3ID44_9FLOR|nr:hypothetical protein BWQ96_10480 [Gracilariopsis chorda]PXF39958.1 hypothetical protein BWQ96_10330 [Gracilariopsis chorda]|eukprot:PXF39810.1 hypothetical protein BWQ96_10480 [Gracilariopsis chorda]